MLIPGLEETDTMVYSVVTAYSPRKNDEIRLLADDVVSVQR